MAPRIALVAALAASCLGLSAAVSGTAAVQAEATGSAYGVTVIIPGAAGASAAVAGAPPDAVSVTGSLSHPADGSAVQAPNLAVSSVVTKGSAASATSSSDVSSVSLFGGEITLASAAARARVVVKGGGAISDLSASSVQGLVVLGQPIEAGSGTSVPAADWGQVSVLEQSTNWTTTAGRSGLTASVLALRVRLTKDHGGLPAGSEILVGQAQATVQPPPPDPATGQTRGRTGTSPTTTHRRTTPRPVADEPGRSRPTVPLLRKFPPTLTPPLTAGGYVFPVYGPSSWSDTFGAPRAAPVGWHHGIDIFASLGAPLLAVADGTLFSVGWNDIGGYRLWLQDREGNEFYYAHLSAFSTLAVEGAEVKAGDVIGFLGATGDAVGTPYHLHFEIHPVSRKQLGYDGAVNPTNYLLAWEKLRDVPIVGVAGWATPIAPESRAPRPGAILLQVTDISSASGLEPGSLRRVLRTTPRSLTADGGLAGTRPSTGRP